MLLFVTVSTVTGTMNYDFDADFNASENKISQSGRAIWDIQLEFDVAAASGAAGSTGVEWDGTYFYSCRWATNLMHQYDDTGSMLKEFSIPGASGSRDFAYNDDAGYMYSGAAATTMWEYDVISETLISSYSMPGAIRALAYDSDKDAFWFNNWGNDIMCADTSGTVLYTITNTISLYSLAFDNLCGDPVLWLFSGTTSGGGCQIEQYTDIYSGGTLGPESHTVGGSGTYIAGGLGYTDSFVDGYTTLMVLGQGDGAADTIFCYEICETNLPPDIPSIPSGPDEGITGPEYTFTTSTDDPELDQVYYMFDWGDGTFSEWIGPFPSGTAGEGSHAWDSEGTYEVRAKAKDINDRESDWSDPHIITIVAGPILDVGIITGGLFKVSVKLKNTGATTATGVQWSINLEGGAFIGKETTGTDDIPAGGEITVNSDLIIGFGATTVTVTAEIPEMSDTRTQDGFVLLFFIKVNPGGGI